MKEMGPDLPAFVALQFEFDLGRCGDGAPLREGSAQREQVGRGFLDIDIDRIETGDRGQGLGLIGRD